MGVVSTFWSANDTESQDPKSQLWMGVVSIFWSGNDTKSQTPVPTLDGGLSLPFDQQVTWSPKNLSPNITYGGVTILTQITSSFWEVSHQGRET